MLFGVGLGRLFGFLFLSNVGGFSGLFLARMRLGLRLFFLYFASLDLFLMLLEIRFFFSKSNPLLDFLCRF